MSKKQQIRKLHADLLDLTESYESFASYLKNPEIEAIYHVLLSQLNEKLAGILDQAKKLETLS
jgi:hypothetical protein